MRKIKHLLLLIAFSSITTFAQAPSNVSNKSETYNLKTMVSIVNKSIIEASKEIDKLPVDADNKKIKIKDAEITFATVYDVNGGGEFKLLAKASKKWELEKTSTLTFSYTKDEKSIPKSVGMAPISFDVALKNAIIQAGKQWKESNATVTGLKKDTFNVEVSFMVKKTTGGGFEFEVWGIGVDAGVDYENSAVHTVSLTFE